MAGFPSVVVKYRVDANSDNVESGGWNIDDFVLYSLDAIPGFWPYGDGCAGSFAPALAGSGTLTAGSTVTLDVTNGPPGAPGLLLIGTSQADADLGAGCSLLVGGLIGAGISLPLDGGGALQLAGPLPVGIPSAPRRLPVGIPSGTSTFFQFFAADAGSATGFSTTNALALTFP